VDIIIQSFLMVFASEMGDKTQLIALLLAVKFKKTWTVMSGILVATLINHGLASYVGEWAAGLLTAVTLKWVLIALFVGFGLWILIPDKEEEISEKRNYGAFLTTVVVFFLAEMGDKTQLATLALGARFSSVLFVTIGSTIGMLAADGLVVFAGEKILQIIPMKVIRIAACLLFLTFAAAIYFGFAY
jgi:Ca2+/H+ antiporter, TMEM165/GDT1 family